MTGLVPTKGLTPTRWPGGARFAPDDHGDAPYRTWLWRHSPLVPDPEPEQHPFRLPSSARRRLAFICLNPSWARADLDDATVRKLIGFAERWGYGALDVCNLWDYRTKDPKELFRAPEPLGPTNDPTLVEVLGRASRIVCAWGADTMVRISPERVRRVRMLAQGVCDDVVALRLSKDGHPWHPLYVPYSVTPAPYLL